MPRIAMVLESEEESGSQSLISLLEEAEQVIGKPDYCVCMDSGVLDYDQFWLTSSLRGLAMVDLSVEFSKVGYHSGECGGIIPETFRVLRKLLDRLDDSETGKVAEWMQIETPDFK